MPTVLPIPYIPEPPLIGSLIALQKDRLGLLTRLAAQGEVSGFHIGPLSFVTFNQPEYMQSLLVEHAKDTNKGWTMHRAFPGNGIFISEGEFHDKQRKIMAPSFTPKMIASYTDIMAAYAERLVASWQDGQELNLTQVMAALTTSIVGKTLFDVDVFHETDDLGKALVTVFNHAGFMINHPFSLPPNFPTPRNQAKDRAWEVIRGRIQHMIGERRVHPTDRNDFLSLLMDARDEDGQPMTDTQLIDECVTLFTGGQETVANALGWSWYLLSQHTAFYQQVQQEVDHVLQGRSPTLVDLKVLPFTLQVFKETLRLYPPAIVVVRQALEDMKVENDDKTKAYRVDRGMYILASIYAIHRSAVLYAQPNTFVPTAFTLEAEKSLPRYGYMPFGAGPRICIGNHFALLEGHVLLAALAQRVTFELIPGQQPITPSNMTLTTKPKKDIRVVVHLR